jgi:hypothetical protein
MPALMLACAIIWTSWLNNLGKEKPKTPPKERAVTHGAYREDPGILEKAVKNMKRVEREEDKKREEEEAKELERVTKEREKNDRIEASARERAKEREKAKDGVDQNEVVKVEGWEDAE